MRCYASMSIELISVFMRDSVVLVNTTISQAIGLSPLNFVLQHVFLYKDLLRKFLYFDNLYHFRCSARTVHSCWLCHNSLDSCLADMFCVSNPYILLPGVAFTLTILFDDKTALLQMCLLENI